MDEIFDEMIKILYSFKKELQKRSKIEDLKNRIEILNNSFKIMNEEMQTPSLLHPNKLSYIIDFFKPDNSIILNPFKIEVSETVEKMVKNVLKSYCPDFFKIKRSQITGMLIDQSVFEVEDILESLENEELLKERIQEAKQLIIQNSVN